MKALTYALLFSLLSPNDAIIKETYKDVVGNSTTRTNIKYDDRPLVNRAIKNITRYTR